MNITDVRVTFHSVTEALFENKDGLHHIKTLPNFSIVQSLSGSYEVSIDKSESFCTGAGEFFIAPPQYVQDIIHHMEKDSGTMSARWVFFDIEINNAYSAELLFDFPIIPCKEASDRLNKLTDHLCLTDDPCDRMSICYQIAKVLLSIAVPKPLYNRSILSAITHIKANYTRKIGISELAQVLHISESSLYALFKKQFGTSPIAYLNDYRLSTASRLLKTSEDSIEAVAQSVGIDDVRYFSKIFKRKYHMTPSEYRNNVIL
ncbi:MAG: helix-turn-helix transcriptional regulator [Clostridia bacterium]|nr:helix-turn-helix transcriptional regulator [Clostridia bacterium]